MRQLTLITFLSITLYAEDVPITVEQLQAKVVEQSKEIEQLRAYIAATEQFDAKITAMLNACIGPKPQVPAKEKPKQ